MQVYPRVYGESSSHRSHHNGWRGLSPRVRGIRAVANNSILAFGSIPACTGNPDLSFVPVTAEQVYPRVYGESRKKQGQT